VTLLRRASREVYRVYSETEFFDGAADIELLAPSRAGGEWRLRRLAGAAVLVGAMGGTVVLASSHPTRSPGRRAGNDTRALARALLATRAHAQLTRSSAAGSDVAMSASAVGRARVDIRVRAGHTAFAADVSHRPRIARGTRAEHAERAGHGEEAGSDARRITVDAASSSAPASTVAPAVAPASAEASDGEPAPAAAAPDGESTPVPAVARSSSPSTTAMSPPPDVPAAERAEFGFER
jgi:hypothetical protein